MISSRFEELQSRCQKIRKRKIVKITATVVFLSAVIAAGYLYTRDNHAFFYKKTVIKKEQPLKTANKKIETNTKSQKNVTLKLKPVINIPKVKAKSLKTNVAKPKAVITPKVKIDQPEAAEKKSVKKPKKPLLQITTSTADTKTVLLKNYSVKKDYTSALRLAEYFLKKRDFLKALYWAKNANKLDSTKENSWIIYAKAKYALGKKEDAIDSLKTFLNIFYSKNADELLQKYIKETK